MNHSIADLAALVAVLIVRHASEKGVYQSIRDEEGRIAVSVGHDARRPDMEARADAALERLYLAASDLDDAKRELCEARRGMRIAA